MTRKDLTASVIIGAAVGLLVQPILANNLSNFNLGIAARLGIFVFFALFAPFALWLCEVISKFVKGFYQFGQFAAVGTLNSFIDLGVFNLETFLYGSSLIGTVMFAVFKAISFVCGTTNSFVWNKYWTFSAQEKPKAGEVTAFYTVAVLGWVLNVGVATLVKAAGSPGSKVWINLVAPLCGIAASFLWDFFGYKYFVFKKKAETVVA
jgi:putative flippase GtrA